MLWRRTLEGKGGRRWRGRNHPKEKNNIFMSADDEWQRGDGTIQKKKKKYYFSECR